MAPAPAVLAFLTLFFAWFSYSLNNVNYGLFTFCLTAYIVCLLALNSLPGKDVAYHRAVSTLIGGGLALTVRLLVIRYRRKYSTPPTPHANDGGELTGSNLVGRLRILLPLGQ